MAVEQLKNGKRAVGTMIRMVRNPAMVLMAKQAGLDFVMYDMEHGLFDMETLADSFKVARAAGVGGFVRIPDLSKGFVSRIFDAGATGVMVPMLETEQQAKDFAAWAKYAPVGKRGFGSSGGHTAFGSAGNVGDFMKSANRETLTIAQIETGTAIENVEKIAAVDGIDALLIGPNDLAISLGVPGDLMGDTLNDAIGKVLDAAKKNGKIFGMHAPDALTERWLDKGMTLVMSGLDLGMISGAMKGIKDKYGA